MGKFRTDAGRMKMEGNEFYLRPPEEMYRNFPGLEDAVARSQQIADTVDIQLELGERYFPVFDLPPERSPEDELRQLCEDGLRDRYKNNPEMYSNGEFAPVSYTHLTLPTIYSV